MNSKRIKSLFIIFFSFWGAIYLNSQNAQNWISHISYSGEISTIAQNGDYIYALTDGKLFIYNQIDSSLEEYIKYQGGNTDITHIAYNKKYKCLIVTRNDASIELLYDNGSYKNIFDLKNYTAQNIDKTINHIFMTDDFAYLSTNYGFSILDIQGQEIKESGIFNKKFYSICSLNNSLYASSEEGVRIADLNSNIMDWDNWSKFPVSSYYTGSDYQFKDEDIRDIVVFKDRLYFLYPDSAVYVMESPQMVQGILKGAKPSKMYLADNGNLILLNANRFWYYQDLTTSNNFEVNSLTYVIPNNSKQNEYWIAASGYNLSLAKTADSSISFEKQWIVPQGPVSNYPFSQVIQNNQLIVTGGGYYYIPFDIPASISILPNQDSPIWSNIYPSDVSAESGIQALDFGYALSDPSNPKHIFASSWGQGLYEFLDGRFVKRYNAPPFEEVVDGNYRATRVGGMAYDKSGNLWILNSMVKNTLVVYKKNGEWSQMDIPDIDGTIQRTNTKTLFIDRYSNKWIGTFQEQNYLFVTNDQGTASRLIQKGNFIDRDNNNVEVSDINDIAEDQNGSIWIATDKGPYWISNSSGIASSKNDMQLNKVKIDRGTGTGSVVGLLEDSYINAIAVDGANRKWIATQTSGVYLLSADNKEILEHFTLEDSPLPSNNVISLAIDPQKGYVYFGTERGLMAYKGGATESADNFSDVYVYPNPVRPDYSGVITVTGLEFNSTVKITDLNGNLIVEGKSLGGQFEWNGLTGKGKRAETGIYLVFASSSDGTEGVVTKIMIVK